MARKRRKRTTEDIVCGTKGRLNRRATRFVHKVIEMVTRHGPHLSELQIYEVWAAARDPLGVGMCPAVPTKRLVAKYHQALTNPDILAGIQDAYALGGLPVQNAIAMHIAHIEGLRYTKTVMVNGQHVDVPFKEKPSFEALKTYLDVAMPKPSKKVDVSTFNVNAYARSQEPKRATYEPRTMTGLKKLPTPGEVPEEETEDEDEQDV